MKFKKILVCPDKFKGSLTSVEACRSIEKGIKKISRNIIVKSVPIADGGEGTLECLVANLGGTIKTVKVTGPLRKKVIAKFAILKNGTGVIEASEVCGLKHVPPEKRNPLETTTFGVGQLLSILMDLGCKKILLGIGGSATNDGGFGMAEALGFSFFDRNKKNISGGGSSLLELQSIDASRADSRLKNIEVIACCDVLNPLTGKNGASILFSPQKGADIKGVEVLESAMMRYATVVERDLNVKIQKTLGCGAGGGLGGGAKAFLKAKLVSGAEFILDAIGFEKDLSGCDLVITGEGKIDGQSVLGKAPMVAAKLAHQKKIPVIAMTGYIGEKEDEMYKRGITAISCIADKPMDIRYSSMNADTLLANATVRILRGFFYFFVNS